MPPGMRMGLVKAGMCKIKELYRRATEWRKLKAMAAGII